jgi:hypothetical protein
MPKAWGERKKRKGHRKVPFPSCLVSQKCLLAFIYLEDALKD